MTIRPRLLLMVAAAVFAAACQYGSSTDPNGGSSSGSSSTPTAPTSPTTPTTPTKPTTPDPGTPTTPAPTPAGLTYATDIAPIMNSDCVRCHGSVRHDAGYNLSTYAGVMRAVTASNASSLLVRVTQPGGIMYSELSGNRTQKAQTIHDWVVTWRAQQ